MRRAVGRNSRASTMISGRQYAVAVDGTVITFECARAGHTYKIDFGAKRRALARRMQSGACKMMASWWSREKGGCIGECPRCLKEEKKANAKTKS